MKMLCFAFPKMKTRVILKFRLMGRETDCKWDFTFWGQQGNQDLYKERVADELYLSSKKCDFSMLSNESLKNKK